MPLASLSDAEFLEDRTVNITEADFPGDLAEPIERLAVIEEQVLLGHAVARPPLGAAQRSGGLREQVAMADVGDECLLARAGRSRGHGVFKSQAQRLDAGAAAGGNFQRAVAALQMQRLVRPD